MIGRPASLKPEQAALVRELRQAYPRAALTELATRLGALLGWPVSKSALHRFMQEHGIARAGYAWPSEAEVVAIASQARQMAVDRTGLGDSAGCLVELRKAFAELLEDLAAEHARHEAAELARRLPDGLSMVLDGHRVPGRLVGPLRATLRPAEPWRPAGQANPFAALVAALGSAA